MSCTLLGSACKTLCQTFSCSCTQNNIYVLGNTHEDDWIRNTNEGLQGIVTRTHLQKEQIPKTETRNRTWMKKMTDSDRLAAVRSGILNKALNLFQELEKESTSFDQAWGRFRLICAVAKVDLEKKYNQATPLTSNECKKIKNKHSKLIWFEELARIIWKLTTHSKCDWDRLKFKEMLSPKQINLLKQKLAHVPISRLQAQDEFLNLDLDLQVIFVEGAFLFPKGYRVISLNRLAIQTNLPTSPKTQTLKDPQTSPARALPHVREQSKRDPEISTASSEFNRQEAIESAGIRNLEEEPAEDVLFVRVFSQEKPRLAEQNLESDLSSPANELTQEMKDVAIRSVRNRRTSFHYRGSSLQNDIQEAVQRKRRSTSSQVSGGRSPARSPTPAGCVRPPTPVRIATSSVRGGLARKKVTVLTPPLEEESSRKGPTKSMN